MKLNVTQIMKRVDSLDKDRGIWRTHWQELYDYMLPRKANVVRTVTKGEKRAAQIFDNTAMVSCDILAGALHGMLTNPNQLWFELRASDPALREDEDVKKYLQELTMRMHDVLNRSNFQTEVHELYLDLACIGTSIMIIEEDEDDIINFSTRFIEDIRLAETAKGRVEEVHRVFKMCAKQIYDEFGEGIDPMNESAMVEKFGDEVFKAYKKDDEAEFNLIHSVYREEIHPKVKKMKPFISQYMIRETKKIIKEDGFRQFPYLTPRWSKISGETYGRSPGMNALPEAKTLNLMSKTVIKGAQKTVDPPLQAPDDGFSNPKRTIPGSLHYYRAGSKDRIEPIYNDARIDFGIEIIKTRQQQIRSAFFVDRLNLEQNDRMTQLEVNQRIEEQFRFLGPMLGRQQSEFLKPMITRILDIMTLRDNDGDLIGIPPDIIQDIELDVVYTSPIARSQRIDQGQSLLRAWEGTKIAMEIYPEAADNINPDKFVKHIWDIYGAPQKVLQSEDEIENIRKSRQEAQQAALKQQQEAHEAETVSKVAPAIQGEV